MLQKATNAEWDTKSHLLLLQPLKNYMQLTYIIQEVNFHKMSAGNCKYYSNYYICTVKENIHTATIRAFPAGVCGISSAAVLVKQL